jgi:Trypsin/PEP-CTERM motif
MRTLVLFTAALIAWPATAQSIAPRAASGSIAGMEWHAVSRIVGQTSTAQLANGGNALYLPSQPQMSGTVQLVMDYGLAGAAACSGSLGADRQSIVTAAHCVSPLASGLTPDRVTAIFWNGDPDSGASGNPLATRIDVTESFVRPGYTGEVIDHNDIAVLRLGALAPDWAVSYELYDGDIAGLQHTVAGYGMRSTVGGAVGANIGTNFLRQGGNTYEFRLGDPLWGGVLNFGGLADYSHSFLGDFDNGLAINDASCAVAAAVALPAGSFCDLGLGAIEVGIAGGDSGGPGFINGRLASVNSYGLSFGMDFGDLDLQLNSSFGEFNGYVPIYLHADWIRSVLAPIPEPGTWALFAAGLGVLGAAARRKHHAAGC